MHWTRRRHPIRRLAKLSPRARAELYHVLSASPESRADTIGRFYSGEETRELADILIDVESDPVLRLEILRLLRDSLKDRPP